MYYNNMVCICIFFKKKNQTREVLPESSIILLTAGRKSFSYRADLKHTHTPSPQQWQVCHLSGTLKQRSRSSSRRFKTWGAWLLDTERYTTGIQAPLCLSLTLDGLPEAKSIVTKLWQSNRLPKTSGVLGYN